MCPERTVTYVSHRTQQRVEVWRNRGGQHLWARQEHAEAEPEGRTGGDESPCRRGLLAQVHSLLQRLPRRVDPQHLQPGALIRQSNLESDFEAAWAQQGG